MCTQSKALKYVQGNAGTSAILSKDALSFFVIDFRFS